MLLVNSGIISIILIIAWVVSSLTKFLFTDIIFVGAMIILAFASAYFGLARREMRKSVKNKSKDEKKKYRMNFRTTEKYAFVLFGSSVLLFIISFVTVK
jgi:hypothetical protein